MLLFISEMVIQPLMWKKLTLSIPTKYNLLFLVPLVMKSEFYLYNYCKLKLYYYFLLNVLVICHVQFFSL